MNQFGLIIQETTAGSNQQFVSAHLDLNNPEIKETITDERTLASQLANLSDVYSVQVTKSYKVYSLIVTNLTDFLGRSGYYAIRLYGPKGVNLTNFESILANIKEKFNNYTKSNTLNNQNYDDILSSILIVENERKNIVALKSTMNFFYYFDDLNSTLSTVFNTKGVHLVNKIYAFNKNKAVNESIAVTSGLKSFSQINASHKEINIVNSYGVLNELKINDQLVDFNPNLTEFTLLCQNNDVLVYNSKDDKTYKTITNNFISIEKKFVRIPHPSGPKTNSNSYNKPKNPNVNFVIVGLMVLILGGGIYTITKGGDNENPPVVIKPPINDDTDKGVTVDKGGSEVKTSKEINFEIYKKKINGNTVYVSKYSKLNKYIFCFGGNKWSFSKKNNTMGDFYIEDIDDKLGLDAEEKKSFIKNLEEISKHELNTKPVKKDTTKEVIKKNVKTNPQNNNGNGDKKSNTNSNTINDIENLTK